MELIMLEKLIGLNKLQLPTPCLIIDKAKILNNLRYMQNLALEKNVSLRPHAKTHKCSEIAKLQLQHGALGICVAKISEALVMAENGVRGILITSPVVAINKIELLVKILKIAPDTMVVIDSLNNASTIAEILKNNNLSVQILLDIDGGIGRTGVALENALEIVKKLQHFPSLKFRGVQCYAGHLQHIVSIKERRQQSHQILQKISILKNEILAHGICCDIITGSGTGTFSIDAEINVMTESQPGSYVVMDQEYNVIEYKEDRFLTAMTMLTTVISANHDTHVTVDAGTKALYRVATAPCIISHIDLNYDWNGFGDEHGKIERANVKTLLPKLGDVLELRISHCDPTINLFDKFYIIENDTVIDVWMIDARGCSF